VAVAVAAPKRRPIRLVVHDDDLRRSRLTVFFRGLLAIPHLFWVALWGIAVGFVSFVNWLAVVINGELPSSLHGFTAGYVRYTTHVGAYIFLAANPYPGFRGRPGYPVDVEIDPPARQSRWSGAFRLVLAFPAVLLATLFGGALSINGPWIFFTYGFALVGGIAGVVAFLAWFFCLALGRAPQGLRDLTAYVLGYGAQAGGYYLLLTGRYPTSDPALAEPYSRLPEHPVQLVVADDLQRSRLTVFFRLLLVIPHFIWLSLWGIATYLAVIVCWFVALVIGRVPAALHRFIAAYLRYVTHVYAYLFLVGQKFPGFTGRVGSYGIDVEIYPPERQRRLTTFFRFFLAFPAVVVVSTLGYVLYVVAVFGWFYALVRGRMPEGLRNLGAFCLRYNAQTYAYLFLLTSRYPYATPVLRDQPESPPRRPPLPMLLTPPRPAPLPMPAPVPPTPPPAEPPPQPPPGDPF
jgi:uncharacterized protein DUF4389